MSLPQLRVSKNNLKKQITRLEYDQTQMKKSIDMEKDVIRQSLMDIQDVKRDPDNLLHRPEECLKDNSILPLRPKSSGRRMGRRHSLPASMPLLNTFETQISKIKLSKSYGDEASCTFTRLAQPKYPVDSFKYMTSPKKKLISIDNANPKMDEDSIQRKQLQRRSSVSAMYLYRHCDGNELQSAASASSMFVVKQKPDELTVEDLQAKKELTKNLAPWEEEPRENNVEKNNCAAALKRLQKISVMSPVHEDSDVETEDDQEIDDEDGSTTPEVKTDSPNEQEKHEETKTQHHTKIRKKKKVKKKKSSGTDTKANKLKLKREANNLRHRAMRQTEKPVNINNNNITINCSSNNENRPDSNANIIENLQRIKSARRSHSISYNADVGLSISERTLTPRPPPFDPEKVAISRGRRKSNSSLEPTKIPEEFDVSRKLRRSLNFGNISVPLKLHLDEKKTVDSVKPTFQDKVWNDVRNCRYLRGYTPPSMRPINGEFKLIDSDNTSQIR